MKTILIISFLLYTISIFSQTTIGPQFSELNGMEDQNSNTHLFYRIYSYLAYDPDYESHNDIYQFDLYNGIDTLFLRDFSYDNPAWQSSRWISDFKFWNHNSSEYIYCGGSQSGPYYEGAPYVMRFDGPEITQFPCFWGSANYIDISSSNDSLLYAGLFMNDYTNNVYRIYKSEDGGWNWDMITDTLMFLSLYPYNDSVMFAMNENGQLFKSKDAAAQFNLVDTSRVNEPKIYYDKDKTHIYLVDGAKLKVSNNYGAQFSWQIKYNSGDNIYLASDSTVSGLIYVANKKNIYISYDYGDHFNLYKSFDKNILGIYKKAGFGILYAITKYKMYQIADDQIEVIKQLNLSPQVLNYYPLAIGNKWIYDENTDYHDPYPHFDHRVVTYTIVGDSLAENGKNILCFMETVVTIMIISLKELIQQKV